MNQYYASSSSVAATAAPPKHEAKHGPRTVRPACRQDPSLPRRRGKAVTLVVAVVERDHALLMMFLIMISSASSQDAPGRSRAAERCAPSSRRWSMSASRCSAESLLRWGVARPGRLAPCPPSRRRCRRLAGVAGAVRRRQRRRSTGTGGGARRSRWRSCCRRGDDGQGRQRLQRHGRWAIDAESDKANWLSASTGARRSAAAMPS